MGKIIKTDMVIIALNLIKERIPGSGRVIRALSKEEAKDIVDKLKKGETNE